MNQIFINSEIIYMYVCMYVLHSCTHTWTLSGFKADFNPLLGTSDSPANCTLCVAKYEDGRVHNLVDTLKRSEPL